MLPWNIRHSGQDNLNLYDRIATFCTPIQRQVTSFICGECPNVGYSIIFGEPAFNAVGPNWFPDNVENLTGSRFIAHPMRMRFRWITHDDRVRIVRAFSKFLSRAMGVPYVDPLQLSQERLDRVLWCRSSLPRSISPENLQRLEERIEQLLPVFLLSDQAARWGDTDGIPQRVLDHIMGLDNDYVRHQMARLNNVMENPPNTLFSFGLWGCSDCGAYALGMYGRKHSQRTRTCTGHFIMDNGIPIIHLGFCTQPNCNRSGWGMLARCCKFCQRRMNSPAPPPGFDHHQSQRGRFNCLVRRYNAGVLDCGFVGETGTELFVQDVLDKCNEVRRDNPNAMLPTRLCFRGNPRDRLLSTNFAADRDGIFAQTRFGGRLLEVIQQQRIEIGDFTYEQAQPGEGVEDN